MHFPKEKFYVILHFTKIRVVLRNSAAVPWDGGFLCECKALAGGEQRPCVVLAFCRQDARRSLATLCL